MDTSEPGNPPTPVAQRSRAFGQGETLNRLDRLSFWLSCRRIKRVVGDFAGLRLADIGCGYDARFARSLLNQAGSITVTDLALASDLKREPGIRAIEGRLPECLKAIDDRSIDVVICNSVIEHLWEPLETLREIFRICAPGGVAFINVPTWRGKVPLEFVAFRLGVSAAEMDDHKMYYDPKDLWPLLVRSGFRPKDLSVFRHKFRFGTLAICRKPNAPFAPRSRAFGQGYALTWIDRFGFWLSTRRICAAVGDFTGLAVADLGCGYDARFARSLLNQAGSITVTDLALASDLKREPGIRAIEGRLPECLKAIDDRSIDVVICNSVIEHLWEPLETLREIFRICAPGGVAFINVPTWRGKVPLEFVAFRLGVSAAEMDDHKMYYDPKDLWPLLVRSGFRPRDIRVFRHKFGLNTFAICRKPRAAASDDGGRGQ